MSRNIGVKFLYSHPYIHKLVTEEILRPSAFVTHVAYEFTQAVQTCSFVANTLLLARRFD